MKFITPPLCCSLTTRSALASVVVSIAALLRVCVLVLVSRRIQSLGLDLDSDAFGGDEVIVVLLLLRQRGRSVRQSFRSVAESFNVTDTKMSIIE